MDRFGVGVVLGVIGGILSLSQFSLIFFGNVFSVRIVANLIAWYFVAASLALLILCGTFMAYRGRKVLGGRIMLATSLGAIVTNLALMMIPGPVGSMIPVLYYVPLFVSQGFLLSMIGGVFVLLPNRQNRIAIKQTL